MVLPLVALAAWRLGAIICLSLTFALSGTTKLRPKPQFVQSVEAFTGLPAQQAMQIARWLPRFELFLSIMLLIPLFTSLAAGVICFLLILFLVGAERARDSSIECGCFGNFVVERPGVVAWQRNLLLILLSISIVLVNVPLVISNQWLLLSALPGILLLASLQIEVFLVMRAM